MFVIIGCNSHAQSARNMAWHMTFCSTSIADMSEHTVLLPSYGILCQSWSSCSLLFVILLTCELPYCCWFSGRYHSCKCAKCLNPGHNINNLLSWPLQLLYWLHKYYLAFGLSLLKQAQLILPIIGFSWEQFCHGWRIATSLLSLTFYGIVVVLFWLIITETKMYFSKALGFLVNHIITT